MNNLSQEGLHALAALNKWFEASGHDVTNSTLDVWKITPYRDAYIFSSGQGRRSNVLYLVRGESVCPLSASTGSLEEAYLALK